MQYNECRLKNGQDLTKERRCAKLAMRHGMPATTANEWPGAHLQDGDPKTNSSYRTGTMWIFLT